MRMFNLFVPKQAVGASLVYFDLFNASGSTKRIRICRVRPVVSGEVAVTGVVAADLFLTKTTAVGTGGTAATLNGSSLTAATFTPLNHSEAMDAAITARLTPTGGATAGAVISFRSVFTEETNAGTYTPQKNMVPHCGIYLPEGAGIRVVQGAVASVGNIGFDVTFEILPPNQ